MGGVNLGGRTSWLRLLGSFFGLVVDVVLSRADERAAANRSVAWRVLADGTGTVDQEATRSDRRIADALNHADDVDCVRGTSSGFAERRPGSREMADKAALAVIVQLPQDSTGGLSEEAVVDVARAVAVTFCGLGDRHQASHADGPILTAVTECDLAKNHQRTQRTLGHVVGGWHLWIIQKHEPLVLMLQNFLMQCEGFFVAYTKGDQLLQTFSKPDLFGDLLSRSEFAVAAKTMKATYVLHELANRLEECEVC